MKRTISGLVLLIFAVPVFAASELTVDNLRVNRDAVFYGNIEMKSVPVSNPLDGLKLFYDFETSETPVADQSGNNNIGTVSDATWISGGQTNGAYQFDGVDDRIVSASNPISGLNYESVFSIALWINKDSACGTDKMPLIIDAVGGGGFGAGFYVNSGGDSIRFGALKQNSAWGVVGSSALMNDTWQFVVGTYSNRNMRLYIDGNEVASGVFPFSDTTETTEPLTLGAQTSVNWFNGKIDEVRVYDRAISPDEVAGLYRYYLNVAATGSLLSVEGDAVIRGTISGTAASFTLVSGNGVGLTNIPATAITDLGGSFTNVPMMGDLQMGIYTSRP